MANETLPFDGMNHYQGTVFLAVGSDSKIKSFFFGTEQGLFPDIARKS